MSTLPKPKLMISASFLGPVFELDGELTKRSQNLIFARNGTGKSFLSRALRYLDLNGQKKEIQDAARNLVSDESTNGKGHFKISRGATELGKLSLDTGKGTVVANNGDTIFHVFSEDFVHEELRVREYEINGKIENQISVDSGNNKIKDAAAALEQARQDLEKSASALSTKFEAAKSDELHLKIGISRLLGAYKALTFDGLISANELKPLPPKPRLADILRDLDRLKALPTEPDYPESVPETFSSKVDLEFVNEALKKITSASSVSSEIKSKIEDHHDFVASGLEILQNSDQNTCPFCEQSVGGSGPAEIIEAYIIYFTAEEEKHKASLRKHFRGLIEVESEIQIRENQIARQKLRFDGLKRYIPSQKETEIDDGIIAIEEVRQVITLIKETIEKKAADLSDYFTIELDELYIRMNRLNLLIMNNNRLSLELTKAVKKSDEERKTLQANACTTFKCEFAIDNWTAIDDLANLRSGILIKENELSELESLSPSTEARLRVAQTFDMLLRAFFADKYIFNKDSFVLKRGQNEMQRGANRTLSDGEKTAIAFCYFLACVHRKVDTNSDYRKLFIVFDDPITSMSYDFVFTISQILKNLGISDQGTVSLNQSLINGGTVSRPDLLILTHSSYFFNILVTNRVIDDASAFALHLNGEKHELVSLNKYIAPFQSQLKDIYDVANGRKPDHQTGNSIRSVLEAIGRFCRPDKKDLSDFVQYLAADEGISIKSILVNSLSHGTYYDEIPPPDDIKLACEETIVVIERFASGQIELIKNLL